MTTAVLVAAGSSARMGFDKLAARLNGRSVLATSVSRFLGHPAVDAVVVVAPDGRAAGLFAELKDLATPAAQLARLVSVPGGTRRQDSVTAGLAACPAGTDLVAVHDAARPLVAADDIAAALAAARRRGGAVLAAPVTDSLLRAAPATDDSESPPLAVEAVPRQQLWAAQTPQCFRLDALRRALAHCADQGLEVTDEVAAARAIDLPVAVVAASAPNFKLTTPADLELARALMAAGKSI